jgi:apolipoprotein N-acyltransferase
MPGTDQLALSTDGGEIGVAICADLGHPKLGRSYARAGAELLAVPALDFEVDDWSQSKVLSWLCMMIALGSGLGLVATRSRITTSSAH